MIAKNNKNILPIRSYYFNIKPMKTMGVLTMFCNNCGAQLPEDSVFCEECGANLAQPAQMVNAVQMAGMGQTANPGQIHGAGQTYGAPQMPRMPQSGAGIPYTGQGMQPSVNKRSIFYKRI